MPLQSRRVLLALTVVLGLLAVGAGVASSPPKVSDGSADANAPAEPAAAVAPLRATLRIGASRAQVVRAVAGRRLQLTVTGADAPDVVAIDDLGAEAQISPDLPATFDLLPTTPGTFPIRLAGAGDVGALRVRR